VGGEADEEIAAGVVGVEDGLKSRLSEYRAVREGLAGRECGEHDLSDDPVLEGRLGAAGLDGVADVFGDGVQGDRSEREFSGTAVLPRPGSSAIRSPLVAVGAKPPPAANSTIVDGRRRAPASSSSEERRVLRCAATTAIAAMAAATAAMPSAKTGPSRCTPGS